MRSAMAATLAVLVCGTANAAGDSCAIHAFTVSQEVTVYAAPSEDSPTLKAISAEYAEAEVREERNGWFRISGIENAESGEMLFEGSGWVRPSTLALTVSGSGNRILYSEPNERSRAVRLGLGGGEAPDLISCRGAWARVRFGDDTGWLAPSGQCSSALTTCS